MKVGEIMPFYYFDNNIDDKGRHKMHAYFCPVGPVPSQRVDIGRFCNPKDAFNAAEKMEPSKSFDGCYFCCRACVKG